MSWKGTAEPYVVRERVGGDVRSLERVTRDRSYTPYFSIMAIPQLGSTWRKLL